MAKCGFYEIRTFETLSRDYGTSYASYDLKEPKDGKEAEETKSGNKRSQKQREKGMLVATPRTEIRGHTGYLTFAIKF